MSMNRRQFCALGTAGALAAIAGGTAMGCASASSPSAGEGSSAAATARAIGDADVSFGKEVDVLIVGAGISGMLSAVDPAKAGLNVLIVEQNATYGGDAIYSAACQMCTTAKLTQEERPDKYMSAEQIREKFAPYYENDEAGLERTVLLQTWGGKFIDTMHYEWGYEFQELRESPYHQAFFPKNGLCTMKDEFELMNEKVTEAGASYLFETTFKTLIVGEDGTVAGGRFVAKDGAIVDIGAKAVVLAGGGYVSNQEWMIEYAPEWAFIGNIVAGRKGDAIAAGVAAGGTLSGMGPSGNLNPRYEAGHMLGTFYPLIGLLPNGKRFYCETAVHDAATKCLAAGYNEWYSIWDGTAQNGIDQEVIAHAGDAVQAAASLEELAEKTGLALSTVQAAFDDWNAICDNQADPEFGKTLFLQKLEPPYYFIRNVPVRYKSCGGLAVSDRMEVLDANGDPIPHLYAAGCTAGTEDIVPAAGSGLLCGSVLAEDLA
ncbi:MAG TPA: FAD-binding protein [Candidatus Rubneribacter avistercoris]|nr:FAD-binding protein [Candidatus Rubneribacter avistercoris]